MRANGSDLVCIVCGRSFYVAKHRMSTAKCCSNACRGALMGDARRGVPLSEEHKESISRGRIGMTFTAEHCANIALVRLGTVATPEAVTNMSKVKQEMCNDPEWRQKMSDQTRRGWANPQVRAAMMDGQQSHFDTTDYGNNFPTGTPQSELDYASTLVPAGYVAGYVIPTHRPENNGGGYYKLDYAHVEAKVNIEIDGSSHRFRSEHDDRRDAFLRARGWKVIRIKV